MKWLFLLQSLDEHLPNLKSNWNFLKHFYCSVSFLIYHIIVHIDLCLRRRTGRHCRFSTDSRCLFRRGGFLSITKIDKHFETKKRNKCNLHMLNLIGIPGPAVHRIHCQLPWISNLPNQISLRLGRVAFGVFQLPESSCSQPLDLFRVAMLEFLINRNRIQIQSKTNRISMIAR